MRKSSLFRLGLSSALIFLAVSCTSQSGVEGEEDSLEAAEQSVDEFGAEGDAGGEQTAEAGEAGDDLAAQAQGGDDLGATSTEGGSDQMDVNESLLPEGDSATTTAQADNAASDDLLGDMGTGAAPTGDAGTPPTDGGTGAGADPLAAGDTSGAAGLGTDTTTSAFAPEAGGTGTTATTSSWEPPTSSFGSGGASKASAAAYAGARVPKISTGAIKRGKSLLNRYYFVRSGDTASSVAKMIYGDEGRAADLKKWNRGKWKAGKLVYYNSPTQPEDSGMLSLYEEKGLAPESYTVGKGDWISRIASKRLGSPDSWKEIAVVNGLSSPDAITRGQELKIYSDLSGAQAVAHAEEPANAAPVAEAAAPAQQAGQPPMEAPAPPVAAQPPTDVVTNTPSGIAPPGQDPLNAVNEPARKRNNKGGLDIGKIVQQNAFFILVGLVISALLIALLAANKRRRGRDEFDEGFAAVGGRKRK